MAPVLLDPPKQRWECPNCDHTAVSAAGSVSVVEGRVGVREAKPGESLVQMHICSGLNGMLSPMVPAGTKAKVEAREREDYIGDQDVRRDGNGRPIMAVVTTRDDGQDCAVMAPTAHVDVRGALG